MREITPQGSCRPTVHRDGPSRPGDADRDGPAPVEVNDAPSGEEVEPPVGTWCEVSTVRVARGATKQRWKKVYRGRAFGPAPPQGQAGPGWLPPVRVNLAEHEH